MSKAKALARLAEKTAAARGETPRKVYTDFLLRQRPLLGAGAVPVGGLLQDDED